MHEFFITTISIENNLGDDKNHYVLIAIFSLEYEIYWKVENPKPK